MEISSNQDANVELKKGPWTREEDQKLLAYIEQHGHGSWRSLPAKAGLQRCGKSCRLRWTNYLRPDIKRGKFSTHEEKAIIRLHALLGNRWSAIAAHLPKRTDNEIKNYWNTRLKKRLARMGIDPTTHKPKNNGPAQSKHAANLSHMAQWETARLEAEARLARESKLLHILRINNNNKPYCAAAVAPPPKAPEQPQFLDVLKVWQATANNNGFFGCGSSGALESPTSTLNFSSSSSSGNNSGTNNHRENASGRVEGKMGNSMQVVVNEENNAAAYGLCEVTGLLDSVLVGTKHDGSCNNNDDENNNNNYNYYHDMTANGVFVGDFEDTKNYWNELLNMVTTPLESPLLI